MHMQVFVKTCQIKGANMIYKCIEINKHTVWLLKTEPEILRVLLWHLKTLHTMFKTLLSLPYSLNPNISISLVIPKPEHKNIHGMCKDITKP